LIDLRHATCNPLRRSALSGKPSPHCPAA
jgi:hypothetical protein